MAKVASLAAAITALASPKIDADVGVGDDEFRSSGMAR